jgi:hypothetical protein
LIFLNKFFKKIIESLIYFLIKLSNRLEILNPCENPIISSSTKAKKFPQNLTKSWVVTFGLDDECIICLIWCCDGVEHISHAYMVDVL